MNNDKAHKLIQDLEDLQIIRVIKNPAKLSDLTLIAENNKDF